MSTPTLTHPEIMYEIHPRPSGGYLLTEKMIPGRPRLNATARGEHSKIIPLELHRPQHIPSQTLKSIGYHSLDDNRPVFATAFAGKKSRELLEAQTFSPQHMKDLGLWAKLVELQSIILKPGMGGHLASLETKQNQKRVGTVYNLTWSVEPNGKDGSIRPGVIAKKKDPRVMRMVELVVEISFTLVKKADGAWTQEHERQWVKEASLTCGDEGNMSVTSIQVNLTAIKAVGETTVGEDGREDDGGDTFMADSDPTIQEPEKLNADSPTSSTDPTKTAEQLMEETLKEKSHVHKDSHDERRNFSCILFLNHVPPTHFVGRFNITNFRLTCTCIPYSALVFTANNPHGGSAFAPYEDDLPIDSPLRYVAVPPDGETLPKLEEGAEHSRCLTIAYSRQDCMRARTKQLNNDISGELGLGAFITKKAQANWMIRLAIRDGVDIGVRNPTVDDYLERFSWVEHGVKCYEEKALVENALALKGTSDKEWEAMLLATGYHSAHLKQDHPSRYESPKQRRARQAREALGDDAYCTQITSKGSRCKAFLTKTTDGVKLCGSHYKIFVASQGGIVGDDLDTDRVVKRKRAEDSEGYQEDAEDEEEEDDEDDDENDDDVYVPRPPRHRLVPRNLSGRKILG